MELAEQASALEARGLGVAALSYDPLPVLQDFAARKAIPFPLLSDPGSAIIRRFGLLNESFAEDDPYYGVPHPGTFVTDARGVVQARFFEDGYRNRRSVASALVHDGEAGAETTARETDHFRLRLAASDPRPFPGHRVTLVAELDLGEDRHAYAAGEHRYRPLRLVLQEHPLAAFGELLLPESEPFHFEPLDETVPVYTGRVRLLQDVVLATGREIDELAASTDPSLHLSGRLEYQVCSSSVCYAPASLEVAWTLEVRPLERERVPEALRPKR